MTFLLPVLLAQYTLSCVRFLLMAQILYYELMNFLPCQALVAQEATGRICL